MPARKPTPHTATAITGDSAASTNPPEQKVDVTVELVETCPMTSHDYDQAVTILATLIDQWKLEGPRPADDDIAA